MKANDIKSDSDTSLIQPSPRLRHQSPFAQRALCAFPPAPLKKGGGKGEGGKGKKFLTTGFSINSLIGRSPLQALLESLKIRTGTNQSGGYLWLVAIYLPWLIFTAIAVRVWHDGKGFLWDIPILQAVHATASPFLDRLAIALTPLGVFWGVFPASVVIGAVLLYRRNWRSLLYLAVTLLGSAAINRGTKFLFHRERPHLWEVFGRELDYSFPSGHAMSSMTFAVVLLVLLWGRTWSWLAAIAGGGFVLAIGWTRVYLGVHYPSDVLGGWLLALGWAMVTTWLIRPLERSGGDRCNY